MVYRDIKAIYIDSVWHPLPAESPTGRGIQPGRFERSMKTRNTGEEMGELVDFDLEKLFRGEVGPNVAEEIAAK